MLTIKKMENHPYTVYKIVLKSLPLETMLNHLRICSDNFNKKNYNL